MPNIVDSTVISGAYSTSGNGGRKLVRLSNGWLIASIFSITPKISLVLHVSKDNGNTWAPLWTMPSTPSSRSSITSVGTIAYVFVPLSNNQVAYCYAVNCLTGLSTTITVDSVQVEFGTSSIIANDAGTELHAAWASKNATYPDSFNIRYAKGTINASTGAVIWGAAEQVTTVSSIGFDYKNPTIVLNSNNNAVILFERAIVSPSSGNSILYSSYKTGSVWALSSVYAVGTYPKSSPSAIFVPKSVNGLANGRIWVTWYGGDSATATANIRVAYSDDGGVTWSAMQKLTTETTKGMGFPVITANKSNQVFILFTDPTLGKINKLSTYNGLAWSSPAVVVNASASNPSALYDPTFNFEEPLFIYTDPGYIGFYGKWTVLSNSATPGFIGNKISKNGLLNYAITTDGTMSAIVETVNGVVVGTKTTLSGQQNMVDLTQAQWDAVNYGKYVESPQFREKNTLTINMGSDVWTYTFNKQLPLGADINQVTKALKDAQEVFTPGVKTELVLAIRELGGTVKDNPKWDDLMNSLKTIDYGYATAEQVLAPVAFRSKKGLETGTIPTRIGLWVALSSNGDGSGNIMLTGPMGFYDGVNSRVSGFSPDYVKENILKGKSIFGVVGTLDPAKKEASGTGTSTSTQSAWNSLGGDIAYYPMLQITGLTFKPRVVSITTPAFKHVTDFIAGRSITGVSKADVLVVNTSTTGAVTGHVTLSSDAFIYPTGFALPVMGANIPYNWVAYE